MGAELAEVAGPPLCRLQRRRMNNELISFLVKGRRRHKALNVRSVAQLGLCVTAHDAEVFDKWHPLSFLLFCHHIRQSGAEHCQVKRRHVLAEEEDTPVRALRVVVDKPLLLMVLKRIVELPHVIFPHLLASHFILSVLVLKFRRGLHGLPNHFPVSYNLWVEQVQECVVAFVIEVAVCALRDKVGRYDSVFDAAESNF